MTSLDTIVRDANRLPVGGEEPTPGRGRTTTIALVLGALSLLAALALPDLVHSYLSILHFDRRFSLDADLGPLQSTCTADLSCTCGSRCRSWRSLASRCLYRVGGS